VLSVAPQARAERILRRVFAEDEFLSPFGLRSLSRRHLEHPFELQVDGATARVDYEAGESTTPMYGGNSNWRGPIWMPLNYLAIEALRAHPWPLDVEIPTGSGKRVPTAAAADDLAARLASLFAADESGRRPVLGSYGRLAEDRDLRDLIPFHEYFHGETGAGLGASHQTGWTGLVAMLLAQPEAAAAAATDTSTTELRAAA
jgi:hypothetical protein